jgi:hypothetical protein
MDTGTGHIFDSKEIKIENIRGDLVRWAVGEIIVVKGCKFVVDKIETFPDDKITLKGQPSLPLPTEEANMI